ncbi:MAG TPA: hypothetical protein DDW30_02115 [Clostridiales bacterium]|nr:hypothetical protein [Clostridiales bacterium]
MREKRLRRYAPILCVCLAALSLLSCRGLRGQEPEQGALVAAIGIDAEGDGVRLSLEVLVPREGDEAERLVLGAVGPTASEAYEAALSGFPRAPLFGHCAVMVFGDGVSDAALAQLLTEDSLPPEMQVVTAPNAAALLALGGLSTPAMGYDLQAMLSGARAVHCRVYELSEGGVDRAALPRFSPAPKGSGKTVLSELPKSDTQTKSGEGRP